MNNQSSPAQLLFPTVPANYCPKGDWPSIFNSFITLFLNNGTVNIPGLGEVTPQQIANIEQSIQNLANQISALSITVQSGSIASPSTGHVTTAITFPSTMPSDNYQINIVMVSDGTATTTSTWSLVAGSKTTSGFSIFTNLAATDHISSIDWTASIVTTTA